MKKILLNILKKYRLSTILIIVFIGLYIYFFTYPATIVGNIIDLLSDIELELIKQSFYLLGSCILILAVRMPWRWLVGYVPRSIERDIKDKLFEQFMKIKMTSIQNIKNGEIMSYFVKDITEIRTFTYRLLTHATRFVFTMIIATATMMKNVNVNLTIATLCPIIIATFLVIKIKEYVEKSFIRSQKYFTELSEYVQESTDAIRTT